MTPSPAASRAPARQSALFRYAFALALVAVSLGIVLLASRWLTATPTTVFFAAVALAAWYGGTGPGLFSTVLSALVVDYFVVPPLYEINLDADHAVRLSAFVIVSLIISGLQQSWRAATARAEEGEREARYELAERQRIEKERTALLTREREARRQAEAAQSRLAFLAEAGRMVASSLDFEATLRNIGRLVVPAISDWCFVYLLNPDGTVRFATVASPPSGAALAAEIRARRVPEHVAQTAVAERVLRGERLLFADVNEELPKGIAEDDEQARLLAELGARSVMAVPLQVHREIFGAVAFVSTREERRFSVEDLSLAEELAGRAAAALSNSQLYGQAQEANRIKDEFLATVSHELRTPLHAILGWTRLLRAGSLNEDTRTRALETIERNAEAQAQLVGDILDVSRIVTGKLKIDVRSLPVATIVESALESVRPAAHAKGIELEASVADPNLAVLADAGRLQQIVWNLLSNAIKFTPGGGHVSLAVRREGHEAVIEVSDTGVGIDRQFLPYVFDRFRQADSSTSRTHGGLGLGLAIVRHLAELHGGSVMAESEGRGSGATFTVRLPAIAAGRAVPAVHTAPDAHHVPPGALHGLRVLAVDDQPDALELVAEALERYGAAVTTASSVREAMAAVETEHPQVLVGDIGMPDEDGFELIRRVRELPERMGGRIPAIALTAYARPEDRDRVLSAGYQIHLPKPIDDAGLVEAVAVLAGRAKA